MNNQILNLTTIIHKTAALICIFIYFLIYKISKLNSQDKSIFYIFPYVEVIKVYLL